MALVRPVIVDDQAGRIVLQAPGMPALSLDERDPGEARQVTVWDDEVAGLDLGPEPAAWFSRFLDRPLRLVRFDAGHRRLANTAWTGGLEARTAFADGYPILNRRLALAGHAAVGMARFRPNLVVDGLEEHGEDHLDEIRFHGADGPVVLKLVKPCPRCPIPDIDPDTAERGHAVGDVLQAYRSDPRVDGALTFGMNAIVVEGTGLPLTVGQAGEATYRFE
jgi:uncharacterized protein YcbX